MDNEYVKKPHSLTIANKITATGIKNVIAIEEKEVRLGLEGRTLVMCGSNFSAEKLSLEEGTITLLGKLTSLRYTGEADTKSLLKKLFR